MTETPATLLFRLCADPAPRDWERFVSLFLPLLRRWAVRLGVRPQDVEDVLQELFVVLIRELPRFRYDPERSFRAWLWTLLRRTLQAARERQPPLGPGIDQLSEIQSPDLVPEATEAEYRRFLVTRITQIVQTDFPSVTWRIFQRVALEGRPGAEVAREFGVSLNAVYLARSRVLTRLRSELAGLE